MGKNSNSLANERFPVLSVVSPARDLLFYERVDFRVNPNRAKAYGSAHVDTTNYPNHKLVYITPDGDPSFHRFYYAADRASQDDYNWEINQGRELIRTYLIPRALYRQKSASFSPLLAGEFTYPPAGTLDSVFTDYGFADDTEVRTETELDSIYVLIRRRFIEPVTEEVRWLDEYQQYAVIRKELVEPSVTVTPPSIPSAGVKIELLHGNKFHDVKVTSTLNHDFGATPDLLAYTKGGSQNFNFPPQLISADFSYIYAWAASSGASPSYSEDFFIDYKLVDPRKGPYEATTQVYYTTDPAALYAANPVDVIPSPEREAIPIMYAWYSAGALGNKTSAYAKQWEVPSSLHDAITIGLGGSGTGTPTGATRQRKVVIPATADFAAFKLKTDIVLSRKSEPSEFGLTKVTITSLNISGIYT